jgi:thymidylate synthase ThyX
MCFEGVSELAATEIEDEQLWDGQARSSRYQDFSKSGFVRPPGLNEEESSIYSNAANALLAAYHRIFDQANQHLTEKLPKPDDMKPDAYKRNLAARAFDIARYTLFWGIPTGVGQVTSIRTLEKQIRRLKASEYPEIRELAAEIADACAKPAECAWDPALAGEALAPTLARHSDAETHPAESRKDLEQWARQNLSTPSGGACEAVDLLRLEDSQAEACATLLYPVTEYSFRELYEMARSWSAARRNEVIDVALRSRIRRDDLLKAFRSGPYAFDIVMDIGAYRDLHRHRRCQQYRQDYSGNLGYETPDEMQSAGVAAEYESAMTQAFGAMKRLPSPASHYLLPFGARSRFLFKMDFAEAEYIARLRSGVKGHFSYRKIAWLMKEKMQALEPELGRLMDATPPWVEDPLKR